MFLLESGLSGNLNAQILCEETGKVVMLRNGNKVHVYKTKDKPNYLYYVPTQFRISDRNGKAEYAFQPYKKAGSTTSDGAIFNMLVTWGLSRGDLQVLKAKVKQQFGPKAIMAGAIDLKSTSDNIVFGAGSISNILKASMTSSGFPPTTGTSKMAMSFKIPKQHVKTINDALKNKSKFGGTTIQMNYKYTLKNCRQPVGGAKSRNIKVVGHLKNMF